jgi:TldD protein
MTFDKDTAAVQNLIHDARNAGAGYADLFIQSGVYHSVGFDNGKIEQLSSANSDGCGARVISGGKTFYSHMPGTSPKHVASALGKALESSMMTKLPAEGLSDSRLLEPVTDVFPPDAGFLHDLDSQLRKESKYVRQVSFSYRVSKRDLLIFKGDGSYVKDQRVYSAFLTNVIVEKDGTLQTALERRYMAIPCKSFWEGTAPADIARTALRRALLMLEAKPCPAGVMNVLLDGESGGTIIHEACGHGLEADIVEKDFSVYRGKIGEKVADESVTMVDDPTLPNIYGHYKFDDEGTPAQRNVLIENGILKRYMTDILSSELYGLPLTGNGRRESYRAVPMPRMSNTFLLPGQCSFDEMLARMGNGLLVKKMGGGEVNPTSGDFVFYVSEAYVVDQGKVKYPVRGAILTGNGPESLRNITALGDNLLMDPGICGKSGQSVPVTDGQPTMLVKNMTVGGSDAQ